MHRINHPELFREYPQRIKMLLCYYPATKERSPLTLPQTQLHPGSSLSESSPYMIQLPQIAALSVAAQLQILLTTGFGQYKVQVERIKADKHRIYLDACSSYKDYIYTEQLEQIRQWYEWVYPNLRP